MLSPHARGNPPRPPFVLGFITGRDPTMNRMPALALVALLGCPAMAAADQWGRSFRPGGRPELQVRTDDAQVRLETWSRPEVGIEVRTRGWTIGPGGIRIAARQAGNRVELEVHEPARFLDFSLGQRSVEIVISLPRAADVDIETGDGNVGLSPVDGRISILTGDGAIQLDRCRGEIDLRSGDGSIKGHGLAGRLTARTNDGSMQVSGRFHRLQLGSGDGSIVAAATAGSRVTDGWRLHTGDGSLLLRLPGDLRADIEAQTGDGSIDLDMPIEVSGSFSRHHVRGRLNGGGPPILLRAGDGSIRIAKL
jgi:putative adhesin